MNDGVAVFSGLTINDPGDGYTIEATLSGLSSATSDAFNVTSQATHLVVETGPPSSVPAGSTIPLVIEAVDDNGNVDASYNGPVTVAWQQEAGPSAAR